MSCCCDDFDGALDEARSLLISWPLWHVSSPPAPVGTVSLYWVSGDDTTPTVGPELDNGAGTPTAGVSTPWQDVTETAITATSFDGATDYLADTVALDPGATDDVRITALVRVPGDVAAGDVIVGTRVAGRGWALVAKTTTTAVLEVEGDTSVESTAVAIVPGAWSLIDGFIDRDGDIVLSTNGTAVAGVACPAGSIASTAGIGIGARPDGTGGLWSGDVAWVRYEVGGSWTPATAAKDMAVSVLGWGVATGCCVPTFARAAAAMALIGSEWHIFSAGMPRSGHDDGYLAEGQAINKLYNTINPGATTGWAATGGVLSVQADTAALVAAGIRCAGPNVLELVNASGSPQYLYSTPTTGNANKHSLSVFGRIVAGAGAEIGWRDASSGDWAKAADLSGGYARTKSENLTPPDTDVAFAVHVPDGCTVRITLPQMEELERCSTPIPNLATAAAATRPYDVLSVGLSPRDACGRVTAYVKANEWSGSPLYNGSRAYFFVHGGDCYLAYIPTSNIVYIYDGTTTDNISNPITGLRQKFDISWGSSKKTLMIDASETTSIYDGSFGATSFGFGTFSPTRSPFSWCRSIMLFRSPR